MYGAIFDVVRDLVITNFGHPAWIDLAAKADLPPEIPISDVLPEEKFENLVMCACEALKKTKEEILEIAGVHFIVWLLKSEYLEILEMGGNTLCDILSNVNSLHAHMKLGYFPEMQPPQFFTSKVTPYSLNLHYAPGDPQRVGYGALCVGVVKGLVEHYFNYNVKKLKVSQLKSRAKGAPFDVWNINWKRAAGADAVSASVSNEVTVGLTPQQLDKTFPFHLVLDSSTLKILQFGKVFLKMTNLCHGEDFFTRFVVKAPLLKKKTSKELIANEARQFDVDFLHPRSPLHFRYQLLVSEKVLIFVGSPIFSSIQAATNAGLSMVDFAQHDISNENLFLRSGQAHSRKKETESSYSDSETSYDESSKSTAAGIRKLSLAPGGKCPYRSNSSTMTQPQHTSRQSAQVVKLPIASSAIPSQPVGTTYQVSSSAPTSGGVFKKLLYVDSFSGFSTTFALLDACRTRETFPVLAIALCHFFERKNRLSDFFHCALLAEIRRKGADKMGVFRDDSMHSALIVAYMNHTCARILQPLVKDLLNAVQHNGWADQAQMIEAMKTFLQALLESVNKWPVVLRLLLRDTFSTLDEHGRAPVISLLILRFVSPIVIFPEKYSVTALDTSAERKSLVEFSKLLQSLASEVKPAKDRRELSVQLMSFVELILDVSPSPVEDEVQITCRPMVSLSSAVCADIDHFFEASCKQPELLDFLKKVVVESMVKA